MSQTKTNTKLSLYNKEPRYCGTFSIKDERENFRVLYLPIKMAEEDVVKLPLEIMPYYPLIEYILKNEYTVKKYVYITVDNSFVKKDTTQRRAGWHSDGFMSDDITYIYCNNTPTIFNRTNFLVTLDHKVSMEQFECQVDEKLNYTFSVNSLLRMDQYVIHRPDIVKEDTKRIFVKISVSKHKYNLEGNSHNPLFEYNWKMYDRKTIRNHPTTRERDFVEGN